MQKLLPEEMDRFEECFGSQVRSLVVVRNFRLVDVLHEDNRQMVAKLAGFFGVEDVAKFSTIVYFWVWARELSEIENIVPEKMAVAGQLGITMEKLNEIIDRLASLDCMAPKPCNDPPVELPWDSEDAVLRDLCYDAEDMDRLI